MQVVTSGCHPSLEPLGQPPAWILLTYGSVCSGIEAVTVAWEPLGFRPAWFAEIDPFCSALLAHPLSGRSQPWRLHDDQRKLRSNRRSGRRNSLPVLLPRRKTWRPGGCAWQPGHRVLPACWPTAASVDRLGKRPRCPVLERRAGLWLHRRGAGGTRVWLRLASAGRSVPRSAPATPSRLRCRTSWRLATCRGGTS